MRSPNLSSRRTSWLIFAATIAMGAPSLVMKANFVREDWGNLYRIQTCGAIDCPTSERARAFMNLQYDVMYTVFQNHPRAIFGVELLLYALGAMFLFRVAHHFVSKPPAAAIALFWAFFPTHDSTLHWASAIHIDTAFLLLVAGIDRCLKSDRSRWSIAGFILLAFSVLSYEATALIAVAFWLYRYRSRIRFLGVLGLAAVAVPTVLYQAAIRDKVWVSPGTALDSQLWLNQDSTGLRLVGCAVAVVAICIVWKHFRDRGALVTESRLIGIGLIVIALGIIPFLTSDYDHMFLGIGDRANFLAAVGQAMIWTAVVLVVARHANAFIATAALVCASCAVLQVGESRTWVAESNRTVEIARAINAAQPNGEIKVFVEQDRRYRVAATFTKDEVAGAVMVLYPKTKLIHADGPGPGVFVVTPTTHRLVR